MFSKKKYQSVLAPAVKFYQHRNGIGKLQPNNNWSISRPRLRYDKFDLLGPTRFHWPSRWPSLNFHFVFPVRRTRQANMLFLFFAMGLFFAPTVTLAQQSSVTVASFYSNPDSGAAYLITPNAAATDAGQATACTQLYISGPTTSTSRCYNLATSTCVVFRVD